MPRTTPDSDCLTNPTEKSKNQKRSTPQRSNSMSSLAAAACAMPSPSVMKSKDPRTPRTIASKHSKHDATTTILSPLMKSLENFHLAQRARARQATDSAAVATTSSCLYCCEETSRDPSSPHHLRIMACAHVACATCVSKIVGSQNECPICRCNFGTISPANSDGMSVNTSTALVTHDDGTFIVIVKDGDFPVIKVSCCWETAIGEILDVIAPHRALEFGHLSYPRTKLSLGLKTEMGGFVKLHDSQTLADIGYMSNYVLSVKKLRLAGTHQIITERLERHLCEQEYPNGAFTLRVRCSFGNRGVHELKDMNKEMKLFEVVHRLKEVLRSSDIKNAKWYGREDVSIALFGSVDFADWDEQNTSLCELRGQGYGLQGILYFE